MRRGFWVALGLGAGATGAVIASRWTTKQARRVAPQTLAREAKSGLLDLSRLVSESLAEGKQAMQARERELRAELNGHAATAPSAPSAAASDDPAA